MKCTKVLNLAAVLSRDFLYSTSSDVILRMSKMTHHFS